MVDESTSTVKIGTLIDEAYIELHRYYYYRLVIDKHTISEKQLPETLHKFDRK